MRNFKIVFGFELKNQLAKKSVIVTTLLIMLAVFALFNIPRIMNLFDSGKVDNEQQQDRGDDGHRVFLIAPRRVLPIAQGWPREHVGVHFPRLERNELFTL